MKDQLSVEKMPFVDQVNTDHFVHVLMDILETHWTRRLDVRRSYVQTIKIVQEIAFVKNIDVLLLWKVRNMHTIILYGTQFISSFKFHI